MDKYSSISFTIYTTKMWTYYLQIVRIIVHKLEQKNIDTYYNIILFCYNNYCNCNIIMQPDNE